MHQNISVRAHTHSQSEITENLLGCEEDDGVVINAVLLERLEHLANRVIELLHGIAEAAALGLVAELHVGKVGNVDVAESHVCIEV